MTGGSISDGPARAGGPPPDRDPGLHRFEALALRHYPFLVVMLAVTPLALPDLELARPRVDWFWLSGLAVFLVAYPWSLRLPRQVDRCLDRLDAAGLLMPAQGVAEFKASLHRGAERYAVRGGTVFVFLVPAGWAGFVGWKVLSGAGNLMNFNVAGALLETFAGVLAGRFVGRAVWYAGISARLRAGGLCVRPASDGAERRTAVRVANAYGTAVLGLLGLLGAFLDSWLLLITLAPGLERYAGWRWLYLGYLTALLVLMGYVGSRVVPGRWATGRTVGIGPAAAGWILGWLALVAGALVALSAGG